MLHPNPPPSMPLLDEGNPMIEFPAARQEPQRKGLSAADAACLGCGDSAHRRRSRRPLCPLRRPGSRPLLELPNELRHLQSGMKRSGHSPSTDPGRPASCKLSHAQGLSSEESSPALRTHDQLPQHPTTAMTLQVTRVTRFRWGDDETPCRTNQYGPRNTRLSGTAPPGKEEGQEAPWGLGAHVCRHSVSAFSRAP